MLSHLNISVHSIDKKIATQKYECVLVDPNDLNRKHIYIQVKKGDVDLNTDDYSSLNGEVYLLTTEGNVQNAQKYSNVKVADPTVIYEFAINQNALILWRSNFICRWNANVAFRIIQPQRK